MLSPKEKAEELYEWYFNLLYSDVVRAPKPMYDNVLKCAIKCVDEMINFSGDAPPYDVYYCIKVKEELNKLSI